MVEFRVPFNRNKQYLTVFLEEVAPVTFHRKGGGRWGYWWSGDDRAERLGWFGDLHIVASRVRNDVVAHELEHVLIDWQGGKPITAHNEERLCRLMDELTRNFWREYKKVV